jgi:hypothetical protein
MCKLQQKNKEREHFRERLSCRNAAATAAGYMCFPFIIYCRGAALLKRHVTHQYSVDTITQIHPIEQPHGSVKCTSKNTRNETCSTENTRIDTSTKKIEGDAAPAMTPKRVANETRQQAGDAKIVF